MHHIILYTDNMLSLAFVAYPKLSKSDLPWLFKCVSYSGDSQTPKIVSAGETSTSAHIHPLFKGDSRDAMSNGTSLWSFRGAAVPEGSGELKQQDSRQSGHSQGLEATGNFYSSGGKSADIIEPSGYLIQILEVISHSGYLYWHGNTFCKECPAGKFGLPLYLHSFRHSVILHEVGIRLLKNLYCAATFFVNE